MCACACVHVRVCVLSVGPVMQGSSKPYMPTFGAPKNTTSKSLCSVYYTKCHLGIGESSPSCWGPRLLFWELGSGVRHEGPKHKAQKPRQLGVRFLGSE